MSRHISEEREEIYGEVWETAPDLKRVHTNVSAELLRLSSLRAELERRKSLFETEEAKRAADSKIEVVNRQISRLESTRVAIMVAVEQQSLTNLSTKVENPLQREIVASLESSASLAVEDAVALREAIESGVSVDLEPSELEQLPSRVAEPVGSPAPASANDRLGSERENGEPIASIPIRDTQRRAEWDEMRTWRDLYGHSMSAQVVAVIDDRGYSIQTFGEDPEKLYRSSLTVHLQRDDGKIVRVPIEKFSESDIIFLARGR